MKRPTPEEVRGILVTVCDLTTELQEVAAKIDYLVGLIATGCRLHPVETNTLKNDLNYRRAQLAMVRHTVIELLEPSAE